jgi:hypothetical protein
VEFCSVMLRELVFHTHHVMRPVLAIMKLIDGLLDRALHTVRTTSSEAYVAKIYQS